MNTTSNAKRLIATAILSASALLLEIVLTRLFSLLYFPPYVFFIISFAIFGIGVGAALPALRPGLLAEKQLAHYAVGASISTLVLLFFAVFGAAQDLQVLLFILLTLPYVFFGLAISALFSLNAGVSRLLYMSDLLGAGIAAILAIPLLNVFGAVNAVLVVALTFAIGGFYLYNKRNLVLVLGTIIVSGAALVANVAFNYISIDISTLATDKPIVSTLSNGGKILQTHWDAFARTDLVDPADGGALRIYVDGAAASIMPAESVRRDLLRDIGFFPFATQQPGSVFVIGPGGGLDVWFGLQSNAERITAVEVNPASVALVEAWRGYNDNVYGQPGVEVFVEDGRSVLRRSRTQYDLIYLSQVVTLAAERGGYALSENTIYTVDAFAEYLAHLTEDGQIALKLYDEVTLTRATTTAIEALRRRDLSDQQALKHLMVFLDEKTNPAIPLLIISNIAFSEDDSLVLAAIARDVGFTPLLLPHVLVQPPLDQVGSGEQTIEQVVALSETDLSAPRDDRPYFFQFERGIPTTLLPLAVIALLVTFLVLAVCAYQWRRSQDTIRRFMPGFFTMLGIGFIAIEISVIQQTRLFLGHPTMAITLVLAIFLIGGGLGSGLSQRFARRALQRSPYLITSLVIILFLVWNLLWIVLSSEFIAATLLVRGTIVTLSLLPLALCMGIPFPQALDLVSRIDRRQVALAWSLNGLMTVVGTILAVTMSITTGFSAVAVVGGAAYLSATLILIIIRRQTPGASE